MTDTERIDALERLVNENGALLLHNGDNPHHHVGLGLKNTGRTLRQAIDQACRATKPDDLNK